MSLLHLVTFGEILGRVILYVVPYDESKLKATIKPTNILCRNPSLYTVFTSDLIYEIFKAVVEKKCHSGNND